MESLYSARADRPRKSSKMRTNLNALKTTPELTSLTGRRCSYKCDKTVMDSRVWNVWSGGGIHYNLRVIIHTRGGRHLSGIEHRVRYQSNLLHDLRNQHVCLNINMLDNSTQLRW